MSTSEAVTVLVTGATGFIGRELVRTLLAAERGVRLIALVRAADAEALARRRSGLIEGMARDRAERLSVVRGDMTMPRLGLDDRDHAALLAGVERVIHCAASIRFDLPLERARRENVDSTRSILELCTALRARGRTGRLDYVGTAFVAGTRQGVVGEEELFVGQAFRNTYEQTKLEAEALCRAARDTLPIVICRPSIVVGRESSGETTSYKAAYGPMRFIIDTYGWCPRVFRHLLPLPMAPGVGVDLVPVDYVASAMTALWARDDVVGRCFHLAAGVDGQATLADLMGVVSAHFGWPRVRFLPPGPRVTALGRLVARPLRATIPRTMGVLSVMHAYGLGMPSFDTTNATNAGMAAPRVIAYFDRILGFASRTAFGRRPDVDAYCAQPAPS